MQNDGKRGLVLTVTTKYDEGRGEVRQYVMSYYISRQHSKFFLKRGGMRYCNIREGVTKSGRSVRKGERRWHEINVN